MPRLARHWLASLALVLGASACTPLSQLAAASDTTPDTPTQQCDFHASVFNGSCSCDAGYHGDGVFCTPDDPS